MKVSASTIYAFNIREEHPNGWKEHLEAARNFWDEFLVSYYTPMMQHSDRTAVLKGSNVPMLFAMGQRGSTILSKDSLTQHHLPQIVYIHVPAASGHTVMMEKATKAARMVTQFVNASET